MIGTKNSGELLNYLNKEFSVIHNVFYLQGLFVACGAQKLNEICIEYAKARKNDPVTFFEKRCSATGNVYFSI